MMDSKIGVCFHPTTIGVVDDNETQLKQLVLYLSKRRRFSCLSYHEPQQALRFLTTDYHPDPFINRCLLGKEGEANEHLVVDFDIRAIHREIHNSQRFNELAVLVIDYAMPGINGVEFCRLLRKHNPYLRIIMLTGEAGKDLAIQIFNEGTIDKFIIKDTADMLELLTKSVYELQKAYFLKLSETVLSKITVSPDSKLSCLDDPAFVELFNQICETNHIVEYYLMDTHGSFLLLDAQGNPSWLAVADEELMQTYGDLAEDDGASESLVIRLKTKQMMPYFHTEEDFTVRPAEWEKYLHAANMLQGKEKYYYTYISKPNAYDIDHPSKIISYQQFLKTYHQTSAG